MKKGIDFLRLLKGRSQTYEFGNKQISKGDLLKILEAGRWAPSSLNTQNWHFIVIKQRRLIEQLLDLCYYGGFSTIPPIAVAVVCEPIYPDKKGLTKGYFIDYALTHKYMNIGACVANMVNEAHALGIDSCILSLPSKEAGYILKIPPNRNALLVIGLGYEKRDAYVKQRVRTSLKELVSYNCYVKK